MTDTTKDIFFKYQVRKTKKQKKAFIEYIKSVGETQGFTVKTEKGQMGAKNIIVGDTENAKVIFTAHYDTCARLPFPNFLTPKNIWIYLLYNLALIIPIFMIMGLAFIAIAVATAIISNIFDIPVEEISKITSFFIPFVNLGIVELLLFGPANKNTANDNTSGVVTLLNLMEKLPENARSKVAFVFFDLEEMGLFGSAGYRSKHKKETEKQLIVNFDCVSDGKDLLFIIKKKQSGLVPIFEDAFKSNEEFNVEVVTKGVFYPSDQANFPKGVGVAAFKKTKGGMLYIDRIHTKKDVIFEEGNIDFLVDGSLKLIELI